MSARDRDTRWLATAGDIASIVGVPLALALTLGWAIGLPVGTAALGFAIGRWLSRRERGSRLARVDAGGLGATEIVSIRETYAIDERDPFRASHLLEYRYRAILDGAEIVGDGIRLEAETLLESIEVLSPDHTLLRPVIERGAWRKWWAHLGRSLARGEEASLQVRYLYREAPRYRRDLYRHLPAPMPGSLVLRLVLGSGTRPDRIELNTWEGLPPQGRRKRCELAVPDAMGAVEWSVSEPQTDHTYEIAWYYDDLRDDLATRNRFD